MRERTVRIWAIGLLISLVVFVLIIILSVSLHSSNKSTEESSIEEDNLHLANCTSQICQEASARVLEKLDRSVKPCDDFYKFACGNFTRNTKLRESQVSTSTLSLILDKVHQQIKTLLEEPIASTDRRYEKLAKSLYQGCMDAQSIEEKSLPALKKIIAKTGRWPMVEGDHWNETNFDWMDIARKFHEVGIAPFIFIKVGVTVSPRLTRSKLLWIEQPSNLGLDQVVVRGFSDPVVQKYYDGLVKIAVMFGADESRARIEAKEVINFDIELIKIRTPYKDLLSFSKRNNPMTVRKLTEIYPAVPWLDYLNLLLEPHKKLDLDSVITVTTPSYFSRLNELLKKTKKRTLVNYLHKNTIFALVPFFNPEQEIRKLTSVRNIATGTSGDLPRWKECITRLDSMKIAVGAMYVKNFFNKESKMLVSKMVKNIRNQFMDTILKSTWMDDFTKMQAYEKALSMRDHIGYPDELLDDNKVDEYYRNLTVQPSEFIESILNYVKFLHFQKFSSLTLSLDEIEWRKHSIAAVVDAYYLVNENSIDVPAALLQDVMFNKDRPQYLNYGSIGYLIGHEITHGFDSFGSQINKYGGVGNWWKPQTKQAFNKRAGEFVEQYNQLYVPQIQMYVNGINTQAENIADNGGIKQAYWAYIEWATENGPEPRLPGMPYSPEQLFWISAAQNWCSVERPEHLRSRILVNLHAPNYFRVNIPLMNSREFAKDFKCAPDSKMNPEYKITIW